MSPRLKSSIQVWRLARDLGMKPKDDPVGYVLRHCEKKIQGFLREFPNCKSLDDLLDLAANRVGTCFEDIYKDAEVRSIREKYLAQGEKIFAGLENELNGETLGITFRLSNRKPWDLEFVSVVDCRDDRAPRSYFTKWHEVAHLLAQTDQMRLSFRRTHYKGEQKDAEEGMMDVVAGRLGFYPPLIRQRAEGEISFDAIEDLRDKFCPNASRQAALIGFVKAWPTPCFLVEAAMGLRKREQAALSQNAFALHKGPTPVLRAIRVTTNDAAREKGLAMFENWRVPAGSAIYRVFADGGVYEEAVEDLSWWETSDGASLSACSVRVMARKSWDSVHALIVPLE